MSDKITKTVTYEVDADGDCKNCDCTVLIQDWRDGDLTCLVFPDSNIDKFKQCQPCKDYLAEMKNNSIQQIVDSGVKIYCKKCKFLDLNTHSMGGVNMCSKENDIENKLGEKPYCVNCKDKEEQSC